MNERVQELAKEVGAYWHHGDFNMGASVEFQEDDLQRFAELLIKECANQCTHDGPFTAEVVWGKQFREKILKHFGVE